MQLNAYIAQLRGNCDIVNKIFMLRIWTIHIPVDELQLKSMKGKIFQISSMTHYRFFYCEKFTETKIDFLRRFIMGNVNIFYIRKSLVIVRTMFQRYHLGTFIFFAMENPR